MKNQAYLLIATMILSFGCSKTKGPKGDKGDAATLMPTGAPTTNSGERDGGGGQNQGPNDPGSMGGSGPGSLALAPSVDVEGAFGLMSMDSKQGAALALMDQHNTTVDKLSIKTPKFNLSGADQFNLLGADEYYLYGKPFKFFSAPASFGLLAENADAGALQKLDSTGAVTSAISTKCLSGNSAGKGSGGTDTKNTQNQQPCQELPQIRTIAQASTGELYFHFDRPYVYKVPTEANVDVWDQKNGYQCQIFKVKGGTVDDLISTPAAADNLECIDNEHFIDQWRAGANGVFQFDQGGNVYYPGSIPGGGKMVLYKRTRDGSATTEVINSNICVKDYLITPAGGTFYTGNTCSDDTGGGGGSGGFFRYVAPGANGQVIEIARNWWNFIYDTRVDSNGTASTDKAVFFGPDPRSTGTAGWDSACLFEFDPSKSSPAERVKDVITCGNDIWGWMELRRPADRDIDTIYYSATGMHPVFNPNLDWKNEYKRRCESKDQVFAGGGSQIQAIKQNHAGEIYVVGNIQKKIEGKLACRVEVRGPHCVVDKVVDLTVTSSSACASAGVNGIWLDKGNCSNGTSGSGCLNHDRHWQTACSNGTSLTEELCVAASATWAAGGCSNGVSTNSGDCASPPITIPATPVGNWSEFAGSCSISGHYSEAACKADTTTDPGHPGVWTVYNYAGLCSSPTLSKEQLSQFYNQRDCQPDYSPETLWYDGVANDSCTQDDLAGDSQRRTYWNDWNDSRNRAKSSADLASNFPKFLINGFSCEQVGASAAGRWTNEYSALAKVDPATHSLKLLSLASEQAIDLWMVDGTPYYSSFDTHAGQYLLNTLESAGKCVNPDMTADTCASGGTWTQRQCIHSGKTTQGACEAVTGFIWTMETPRSVLTNFETYHVARTAAATQVYADGLDFGDNAYKFGKITISNGAFTANQGLTGRVNAIVILDQQ